MPLHATNNERAEQPILSRRLFMQFLGGMVTAVALEQTSVSDAEAQERPKGNGIKTQEPERRGDQQSKTASLSNKITTSETKNQAKENPYITTAIEQSLMMVARVLASAIFDKLKIEHDNKSLNKQAVIEYLQEKPLKFILKKRSFRLL